MKIMIEVRGGTVQNIVASEAIEIFLVDHDNLERADSEGAEYAEQDKMDIMEPMQPHCIIPDVNRAFETHVEEAIINS